MTSIDARGAIVDYSVTPDGDLVRAYSITTDGSPRPLGGAALNIVIRDTETSDDVISTILQEITDAANGLFNLKIPKTIFQERPGQEVYYQLIISENGDDMTLQSGHCSIAEVR